MSQQARRVAKARSWKKIQAMRRQASYWRQRWASDPGSMRSNLDRINGDRQDKAAKRTEVIKGIIKGLPATLGSLELRPALAVSLSNALLPSTDKDVEKLLSNLRRRGMVRFDSSSLRWQVMT